MDVTTIEIVGAAVSVAVGFPLWLVYIDRVLDHIKGTT
jgi:hypothetical protein